MAEGFGRSLLADDISAESAGIRPIGIDDRAIQVMDELGIDLRTQTSSSIDEVEELPNLTVVMSHAVQRKLPDRFRNTECITWSITDPYHASGSKDQQLEQFRTVRDHIRTHVQNLSSER